MATNTKPLKKWSTEELQTAIQSGYFHDIQKSEAERILRERAREPDRKLARRTYNAAAWARAYSEGTFIVALIIVWLVATGEPPLRRVGKRQGSLAPRLKLHCLPPRRSKLPSLRLRHWPFRRWPRRKKLQRHHLKLASLSLHRLPLRGLKLPSRRPYRLLPRQSPSLKRVQRTKPPSRKRHLPLPRQSLPRQKLRCLRRNRPRLLRKSPWLRRRRPTRQAQGLNRLHPPPM